MFSIDQEWKECNGQDALSSRLFVASEGEKRIPKNKKRKLQGSGLKTDTVDNKNTINSEHSSQNHQRIKKGKRKKTIDSESDTLITNNESSDVMASKKKKKKNSIAQSIQDPKPDVAIKKIADNIGIKESKENRKNDSTTDEDLFKRPSNEHINDKKKNNKKNKRRIKNKEKGNHVMMPVEETNQDIISVNPDNDSNDNSMVNILTTSANNTSKNLSKFQKKLNRKLEGGHFRWINETLYTSKSSEAQRLFEDQPQLFDVYHKGFESQVENWPINPIDVIISYLKERSPSLVIADFGCGNAKLSQNVANTVHSFDLVAINDKVVACDMKRVPLLHHSVDVAVFSLALMGTNVTDFILEANRVLKIGGILKIAEVKSRFKDINGFVKEISSLGFRSLKNDDSNKMFVLLDFEKHKNVKQNRNTPQIELKPCIYKRR